MSEHKATIDWKREAAITSWSLTAVFGCLHPLRRPIAGILLTWTLNRPSSGPYPVVTC
jgi:hypothetical protein